MESKAETVAMTSSLSTRMKDPSCLPTACKVALPSLSTRMKDPSSLLTACKVALPSWSEATLDDFTSTVIKGGFSSPGLYLATCSLPEAYPSGIVIKLEPNSEHSFHPFYVALANSEGPYEGRVSRQLGKVGLGPRIFYMDGDKWSPNYGLMAMEALQDGGFHQDFDDNNVSMDFINAMGSLLGSLHLQPTMEVEKHANLTKQFLLESKGLDLNKIEELYNKTGGYTLFLVYWWKTAFPNWMKANSPTNYPLPQAFSERLLSAILDTASIKPLNPHMGKLGLSHFDLWHGNIMKKKDKLLAIDCETCSIGPAFLDFGAVLYNWEVFNGKKPYFDKTKREALALSFFKTVGQKCENMDEVLYDLELAAMHRNLWIIICGQFDLVGKSLEELEEIGGLMIEKAEVMLKTMKKALKVPDVMEEVIENGVYGASRHLLSEKNEEKLQQYYTNNVLFS